MAHHASTFYSLKFAAIVLLSGCATATFYSRGNAENPPIADDASSQIELVNAELEVSDSREDDVTGKDNINTFPDGRVEDESNIEKDVEEASTDPPESPEEKSFLDYLSGRNVAADIPYAKELPWVGAPDPSKKAAESLFDRAEVLFATKEYSSARTQYAKAADRFPDSSVEEDALFKIAECYFFEDKYPDAFEAYEALLVNYKRSKYLDTAVARQFAIGRYWQKRYEKDPENVLAPNVVDKTRPFNDLQGSALRAFEKVRLNHPTGSLADDSLMATATANFLRSRYDDADYYYGLVRQEYPGSEHQYQAHVLGIQAKIRRYQGPKYEGTCLIEAKKLIEQTMRQFREMSPEDRQRMQKLHAQVSSNLAMRDLELAEFYSAKGFHGAARNYYNLVLDEFPHTDVAQKAENQIEEIKDELPEPTPRFVWISSLFPESRKDPLELKGSSNAKEPDADQ